MKEIIDQMVARFLGWKLPKDFSPDDGISFKPESDYEHPEFGRTKHEPTGTNLFSAEQAKAMIDYITAPLQAELARTQLLLAVPVDDQQGTLEKTAASIFAVALGCLLLESEGIHVARPTEDNPNAKWFVYHKDDRVHITSADDTAIGGQLALMSSNSDDNKELDEPLIANVLRSKSTRYIRDLLDLMLPNTDYDYYLVYPETPGRRRSLYINKNNEGNLSIGYTEEDKPLFSIKEVKEAAEVTNLEDLEDMLADPLGGQSVPTNTVNN